jgi:hypothetical protein
MSTRRLAAIPAEVIGFGKLNAEDATATVASLRKTYKKFVDLVLAKSVAGAFF